MKFLSAMNAVPIAMGIAGLICLAAALPAHAACSMEQTASNEIIIRVGAGGCDGAALRQSLVGALGGSATAPATAAIRPNGYQDAKRSAGQGALWRLANVANQVPATSFTMPGAR